VQIAKEAVEGGIDWIEIGTPFIKSEGMDAIRTLRENFPEHTIVADMKIADTGSLEVEMAAKAGADIVMVMATADVQRLKMRSRLRKNMEFGSWQISLAPQNLFKGL